MDVNKHDYSNPNYWEYRYSKSNESFDWYFDGDFFIDNVLSEVEISSPVLVVGCGDSDLSDKLSDAGHLVVSTDISQIVISRMNSRSGNCYLSMDVTSLQFRSCRFDCVIDKGTLDALLCQVDFEISVSSMLTEIRRVLTSNGLFILITHADPEHRLPFIDVPDILHWNLEKHIEFVLEQGSIHVYVLRAF